jgi:hypothetical protein
MTGDNFSADTSPVAAAFCCEEGIAAEDNL